jgi:glycosyltransferase involved in cell wall biosynthesis
MKSNVIFLVKSEKTPSSRIRIANLLPFLVEEGIHADIEYIPKSFVERHKLFQRCAKYDMVLFQKRLFTWFEFCELRKNAARLAFDFDDAVYMKNRSPSANLADYKSATRVRRFKRIIKSVDLVIAANSVLASEAARYTKNSKIKIIPSSVDLKNISSKTDYSVSSPPVIGWVGSKVTQRYLDYLSPQLCELRKKHKFILRVISNQDYHYDGLDIENIEWSLENENCEIRKFDIGIMPLSSDPFSNGKASYKLLQYLSYGIPSVASAVGMNIDVADNEKNALLADSTDEFIEKLSTLIKSCELRRKLGVNGRKLIEKSYSQTVIGANFAKIISTVTREENK